MARMMVPQSKGMDPGTALELLAKSEPGPGVDPALWQELTAALASALEDRKAGKTTSERPTGAENAIVDLVIVDDGAGGQQVEWSYVNNGDYDQNGEVGISDLTPIAVNYYQNSTEPGWDSARLADGDGNV